MRRHEQREDTTLREMEVSKSEEKEEEELQVLLGGAGPFLRRKLEKVDPALPHLASVLRCAGARECYHKHGTFLAHLMDDYRILKLWGSSEPVARCSSYSNSYVNLAIFHPDTGRDRIPAIIGEPAERLVHLFCIVPRHKLIHDDLMFPYTDQELRDHLQASSSSSQNEEWRMKLACVVPVEGVVMKHIRTGEPVRLPRRVVAIFILMTVADFSDQYTDYQDKLFDNEDGKLEFRGDLSGALWSGTGKPGLWLSAMLRLAVVYNLIARDEKMRSVGEELVIPPVFEHCTRVLDPNDQKIARDLYWEAINNPAAAAGMLRESIALNPFVGEPHLVTNSCFCENQILIN